MVNVMSSPGIAFPSSPSANCLSKAKSNNSNTTSTTPKSSSSAESLSAIASGVESISSIVFPSLSNTSEISTILIIPPSSVPSVTVNVISTVVLSPAASGASKIIVAIPLSKVHTASVKVSPSGM